MIPESAVSENEYSSDYSAAKAVDGDLKTRWATRSTKAADLELSFVQEVSINSAYINQCQDYGTAANNIKEYSIDYWNDSEWVTAYDGGEIGKETSVKFDAFRTTKVRLHITDGNNPSIYEFQLFYQEGADQSGTIAVTRPEVLVQTGSTNAGCTVYEEAPFEIAGTYEGEAADAEVVVQEEGQEERFQGSLNPDGSWSVQVDALPTGKITVSAILKNSDGGTVAVSDEKNAIIRNGKDLARNKETEVTTGYNNLGGDQAVDGRTGTRWAPNDSDPKPALTVKLGEPTQFNRIIMREMFDRWNTSIDYRCKKFKLEYLENDSSGEWKPLAEGTDIGEEYVLNLDESVTASQIRVTMDECSVVNGKTYMASLETFEVYYIPRTTEPVEPEDPIDVRTADSIIETRDYQKANVKGTASANDNAPDPPPMAASLKPVTIWYTRT